MHGYNNRFFLAAKPKGVASAILEGDADKPAIRIHALKVEESVFGDHLVNAVHIV